MCTRHFRRLLAATALAAAALLVTPLASPLLAQAVPQPLLQLRRIDAKPGFDSLAAYNEHIAQANRWHNEASRLRTKTTVWLVIGLAAAAGSAAVYSDAGDDTGKLVTAGALGGVALIGIIGAPGDYGTASTYEQRERQALARARAIYPQLDPRK